MRREHTMPGATEPAVFLMGLAVGAALMYLLDPDRGRRRRALLRDQFVHGAHEADDLRDSAASSARHLRNRARGVVAETRSRMQDARVEDSVLEGRLRAELGRLIQPVGDIRAEVLDGAVRLTGTIEPEHEEMLIRGLEKVPGVQSVSSQLRGR